MQKTFGDNFKTPINTSVGGNAFSFAKKQRFEKGKASLCKSNFYNTNDDTPPTRAASFGCGQRSSMVSTARSPSPNVYNPESSRKFSKGYSFSNNRRISFIDEQAKRSSRSPSPTNYQKLMFGSTCHTFTFRSKYQDPLQKFKLNLGPGQYNVRGDLHHQGNYFESKHRSSGCGRIGKQKRFESHETFVPGPGKYKQSLNIDPMGNYFNSKVQSKGVRSFGKPTRHSLFAVNMGPGPGTYYDGFFSHMSS